ncbi:hypothetical protein [Oscillibacter sp.]|uniref:hypothetical protein n=1 Tax=Oscillibacter sp. TaxID=1945593 RepID=UPI00339A6C29
MNITNITALITIIGALTVVVNLLTEVVKKSTWNKIPTNILVVLLSVVLTLVAFFAYCQINAVAVLWYMVVAAVIVGLLVAYSAMFGFDKLKEALAQITVGDLPKSLTVQADADVDSIAATIAQKVQNAAVEGAVSNAESK